MYKTIADEKVDMNLKSLFGRGSGEEFQARHPATTS